MTPELRPYQHEAVARLRKAFRRHRRVLFTLPTGGGKTVVFAHITARAAARGRRTLVLVHRRELLCQASAKLDAFGVPHGCIAPGFPETGAPVQVGIVQTVARRLDRLGRFDFLVVDEAHHAVAGTWRDVLDRFAGAHVPGATATPGRLDGRGLGDVCGVLVEGPAVAELIRDGWLAPYRVFAPPHRLDLSGVRVRGGDYAVGELAEAMRAAAVTADAIEHYERHALGRPEISFCVTVAHAREVAEAFTRRGHAAAAVDGSMSRGERDAIIGSLGQGLDVLTSCELVSEGLDVPEVGAAILLRPTKSLALYLQQVGRALRPEADNSAAVILDHVGDVLAHGLPDRPRFWSLEGREKRTGPAPVRICAECHAAIPLAATECPECGGVRVRSRRPAEVRAGALRELDEAEKRRLLRRRLMREARTFEDLQRVARELGYRPGWAWHTWRVREQRRRERMGACT